MRRCDRTIQEIAGMMDDGHGHVCNVCTCIDYAKRRIEVKHAIRNAFDPELDVSRATLSTLYTIVKSPPMTYDSRSRCGRVLLVPRGRPPEGSCSLRRRARGASSM
eukprot:scaffold232859_cov36-Tisochrysis_lutea.AAC.3